MVKLLSSIDYVATKGQFLKLRGVQMISSFSPVGQKRLYDGGMFYLVNAFKFMRRLVFLLSLVHGLLMGSLYLLAFWIKAYACGI